MNGEQGNKTYDQKYRSEDIHPDIQPVHPAFVAEKQ
jgi:hypothetical protein